MTSIKSFVLLLGLLLGGHVQAGPVDINQADAVSLADAIDGQVEVPQLLHVAAQEVHPREAPHPSVARRHPSPDRGRLAHCR